MNYLLISQIAQAVFCLLITLLIMVQYKGKGLTSSIGSSFAFYGSRRGVEKIIFGFTIVLTVLISVNSLLLLLLSK